MLTSTIPSKSSSTTVAAVFSEANLPNRISEHLVNAKDIANLAMTNRGLYKALANQLAVRRARQPLHFLSTQDIEDLFTQIDRADVHAQAQCLEALSIRSIPLSQQLIADKILDRVHRLSGEQRSNVLIGVLSQLQSLQQVWLDGWRNESAPIDQARLDVALALSDDCPPSEQTSVIWQILMAKRLVSPALAEHCWERCFERLRPAWQQIHRWSDEDIVTVLKKLVPYCQCIGAEALSDDDAPSNNDSGVADRLNRLVQLIAASPALSQNSFLIGTIDHARNVLGLNE